MVWVWVLCVCVDMRMCVCVVVGGCMWVYYVGESIGELHENRYVHVYVHV